MNYFVEKPIFIVGCGRSGTGMLFDLIGQHPTIKKTTGYPDGEDHDGWIKYGHCVMAGIGNHNSTRFGDGINGYQYCLSMTENDLNDDIVKKMHSYYFNHVLQKDAGKRSLNKQPHLSNKLKYLLGIFPDAKIIHIIRDCEHMVASWKAIMKAISSLILYLPPNEEIPCFWLMKQPIDPIARKCLGDNRNFYPGGGEEIFIDYWNKVNIGIPKQMTQLPEQLLTIRYEEIIKNPKLTLNRIFDYCELDSYDIVHDHIQTDTFRSHIGLMNKELRQKIIVKTVETREYFGYAESNRPKCWSLLSK